VWVDLVSGGVSVWVAGEWTVYMWSSISPAGSRDGVASSWPEASTATTFMNVRQAMGEQRRSKAFQLGLFAHAALVLLWR
jgi:hypothetical protein